MKTSVVNITKLDKWWMHDDSYVYIGRAGKGLSGEFGNPFPLEKESDRDMILNQYRDHLEKKIKEDQAFREKVKALHGKRLVCFCHPKKCHGDILAEVSDRLNQC
jgi:hypothetical protein